MIGDQRQHDGRLVIGIEVGPVQRHHDGASRADDIGHPAGEDIVDVDLRVGEQTIHLLGRMLGVQGAGGSEPLANGADREGGAAQHAKGGVASEATRLACRSSPSTPARTCLIWLLDNRCSRMTIVSLDRLLRGGRFAGSRSGQSRLGEFARICRRRRSKAILSRNRPYGPPILLCPKKNEGMSEDCDT